MRVRVWMRRKCRWRSVDEEGVEEGGWVDEERV